MAATELLAVVGASGTEFAARAARMDAASIVGTMIFIGFLVMGLEIKFDFEAGEFCPGGFYDDGDDFKWVGIFG